MVEAGCAASDAASRFSSPAGAPESADVQRAAGPTIDEHGKVKGSLRLVMASQEALD
jgi:hypothetical protein